MTDIENDQNTEIDLTKYMLAPFVEKLSESEKERYRNHYRKREKQEKEEALKKQTEMASLQSALSQALVLDDHGEEILKRQLSALDTLFEHTVKRYSESYNSDVSETQTTRLNFAMRLQSQSMTTAMTLSKMVYMDKISQKNHQAPTPLAINDEQKELGKNDS